MCAMYQLLSLLIWLILLMEWYSNVCLLDQWTDYQYIC